MGVIEKDRILQLRGEDLYDSSGDKGRLDRGDLPRRRDRRARMGARRYLTVILRRATGTAIAARLRDAFGLTAREAAVLALVVRGHRPPEIAHELVIAAGTARKHIERV
jgi:DNA-binding CsgD family transcriptional regulator